MYLQHMTFPLLCLADQWRHKRTVRLQRHFSSGAVGGQRPASHGTSQGRRGVHICREQSWISVRPLWGHERRDHCIVRLSEFQGRWVSWHIFGIRRIAVCRCKDSIMVIIKIVEQFQKNGLFQLWVVDIEWFVFYESRRIKKGQISK